MIVGTSTLLLLAFIAIFFVWPRIIEKRVHAFCDSVEIGLDQDAAITKARTFGLKVKVFPPRVISPDDPQTTINNWDGVSFDRYFCTLKALNGKITSKKAAHID